MPDSERFLTLEWHPSTKTTTAACSCGQWESGTEESDPYRDSLFRIDALTHEWALRHRSGPRTGSQIDTFYEVPGPVRDTTGTFVVDPASFQGGSDV